MTGHGQENDENGGAIQLMPTTNDKPVRKTSKKKTKSEKSNAGARKNQGHHKKMSSNFEDIKDVLRDELLSINFNNEEEDAHEDSSAHQLNNF